MTDVIMPQMGESIAEGTITKWMKNVGDKVERDEPLFEISTDKVDAEIPSPAAGILKEIRVQPGATVPINTVVGVIAAAGEAVASAPAVTPAPPPASAPAPAAAAAPAPAVATPAPPPAPPAPVAAAKAPQADGMPGPAPMPSPVAPPPAPAPLSNTVALTPPRPPVMAPPPPAPPPAPAAVAQAPPPAPPAHAAQPASEPPAEMSVDELRQTRSSPVVRKIAAEHNVDIREIPGTGISGRVTKHDILGHLETRPTAAAATPPWPASPSDAPAAAPATVAEPPAPTAPAVPGAAVPAAKPGDRIKVVPMSPIRRKTAEHMVQSKHTSAHVTTFFEVDMTRVHHLRAKHRAGYLERSGVKLTYMPFVFKATVDALKAFPILNSSVEGDAIVYRHDINLGMAVALDWGLIVPVIRNADEKNLLGMARAINDLADRARTKRLKVDEVQGGTFTVTNPGVFGSLIGTPIINQPQVGILGVGTIEKRPVVRDDAIAIRTMAYLALSFDHRIVDGSDADRFMAHIKQGLQEFDESAL